MNNALPAAAPHDHASKHAPNHVPNHVHGHHRAHGHQHSHGHQHHDTPATAAAGGFSLLALSSLARLALVVPPVALLWLLTAWAMNNG
jgi:hypothetical protein